MFDNMAKQVMYDAERLASDDGSYVHLQHLTKALLQGQGISNTILKSLGLTQDNVPQVAGTETRRFFKSWRNSDNAIYAAYYSPAVVAVWYYAQCLQTETGRSDATEFFLLGLLEQGGAYSEELQKTFDFNLKQVYQRIHHLQAVSLWTGFEPETHARRFFSLAQIEQAGGNTDEALKLVRLAIDQIRQAKKGEDHRLLMARAQTVKQAARFYKSAGQERHAQRYAKLAHALAADVMRREDANWQANQLGFNY
ncbi:MAG: hypothetical protein K2Y22_14625 [Candidatus Obscuribacterales bacterium]|nr:hypothetical protein [Candidatus Obscuribacterales bacterium]